MVSRLKRALSPAARLLLALAVLFPSAGAWANPRTLPRAQGRGGQAHALPAGLPSFLPPLLGERLENAPVDAPAAVVERPHERLEAPPALQPERRGLDAENGATLAEAKYSLPRSPIPDFEEPNLDPARHIPGGAAGNGLAIRDGDAADADWSRKRHFNAPIADGLSDLAGSLSRDAAGGPAARARLGWFDQAGTPAEDEAQALRATVSNGGAAQVSDDGLPLVRLSVRLGERTQELTVAVVRPHEFLSRGVAGRRALPADGLLFDYTETGEIQMWWKAVRLPGLSLIGLNEDGTVSAIAHDMPRTRRMFWPDVPFLGTEGRFALVLGPGRAEAAGLDDPEVRVEGLEAAEPLAQVVRHRPTAEIAELALSPEADRRREAVDYFRTDSGDAHQFLDLLAAIAGRIADAEKGAEVAPGLRAARRLFLREIIGAIGRTPAGHGFREGELIRSFISTRMPWTWLRSIGWFRALTTPLLWLAAPIMIAHEFGHWATAKVLRVGRARFHVGLDAQGVVMLDGEGGRPAAWKSFIVTVMGPLTQFAFGVLMTTLGYFLAAWGFGDFQELIWWLQNPRLSGALHGAAAVYLLILGLAASVSSVEFGAQDWADAAAEAGLYGASRELDYRVHHGWAQLYVFRLIGFLIETAIFYGLVWPLRAGRRLARRLMGRESPPQD